MQIACPNCATSYEIAPASLGESGRTVRCAHCKETWFAEAPQLAAAPAVAAPSMWQQQEERETGWDVRDDSAPVVPEDRFAGQQPEVEFALPQDMPDFAAAPSAVPEPDAHAAAESAPEMSGAPEHSEEPDYHEVRRRRHTRPAAKRKSSIITKPRLIAASVGILVALMFERENVARLMPQMASLYGHLGMPVNLRGLSFEGVRGIIEQQDGVSVLVIEGAIRNVTRDSIEVPRLRFAMRNAAGAEIYSWTALPERGVLPPREVQTFRTRLASPPSEGRQAYVRFFQRRDIVATSQR
jgi:predicted Zn finger-like uncharacterized protein